MEYTLKLAIIGACLFCLAAGIAIGHLSSYLTLRSKLRKEEYLFDLRMKQPTDTIGIIREAAKFPSPPPPASRPVVTTTSVMPPVRVTPAHRMPSPSALARRQAFPLTTPSPTQQTLSWVTMTTSPGSKG